MAKAEYRLTGDFDYIVNSIERGIVGGSTTASLEESSDFNVGNARCSVRVFERYSYSGGNRVSMNITFFQSDDGVTYISAITSGGSQALFFKFNTIGEESFLDKLRETVEKITR